MTGFPSLLFMLDPTYTIYCTFSWKTRLFMTRPTAAHCAALDGRSVSKPAIVLVPYTVIACTFKSHFVFHTDLFAYKIIFVK